MRNREAVRWFGLAIALVSTDGTADPMLLGRSATPEEIRAWDISIAPDGTGLPPGEGRVAEGAAIFARKCQACHGKDGEGKPADRLVGGANTLATGSPVRTIGSYWPHATTLFDYLRRAMPYPSPRSLSDAEVYALCAFLLWKNEIVGDGFVANAATIPRVRMPNRGNFIESWPTRSE